MSLVNSRLSAVYTEGFYGEPEQDANSALTELDKGLRSAKVGEQCEAIVRFPKLFEKYPFPILINSAFLKLADVFRVGSNFLRLWVLKVTQQAEKHLDKILNVDEYVKRIYTVIYSNDPMARALTLRTLGSIASIIPERKNVHHSIRDSFDSHNTIELDAAVFAAQKFSKYSKDFSASICDKIEEMIHKLSTPVDMKLKLIPILQNMYHDTQTSSVVRKLCTHLLDNYPSEEFISVTLHTLTNLSAATMVHIPEQVKMLVKFLDKDPRVGVKCFILKELNTLAIKGAHLWNSDHIMAVNMLAHNSVSQDLQLNSFQVLVSLSEYAEAASKLLSLSKHGEFSVLDLCQECCYSDNPRLSSLSVQLYTLLALYEYQAMGNDEMLYNAATAIECVLIVTSSQPEANAHQMLAMKKCLMCAVKLCKSNLDLCYRFVDTLGELVSAKGRAWPSLCDTLCAIGNIKSGVLSSLLPDLIEHLKSFLEEESSVNSRSVAQLCTLIFQANKDTMWLQKDKDLVLEVVQSLSLWEVYRIGRQAARYGHHSVASKLFSDLTTKVCSEHHYFWLVSLAELCKAETFLHNGADESSFMDMLNFSIMHYMKGISALKAATTPVHQMDIQCEYIKLRSEMLKAYVFLMQTCNTSKSCPPPAIAASIALSSRDDLQKLGRVIMQLRKAAHDFHRVAAKYKEFSQALFNADPVTFKILQILQYNCLLTAHAIGSIVLRDSNFPFHDTDLTNNQLKTSCLEVESMAKASSNATKLVTDYLSSSVESENINYKHFDVLMQIMRELLRVPISFPRYYFQSLQATSIKLAISPQQKSLDPVQVQNTSHLAVKVEGVVQHNSRTTRFRDVANIQLSVCSNLQIRHPTSTDIKIFGDTTNNMKQIVKPHNDYFSAQFLLVFPVPGIHVITVATSLIDQNQDVWNTGPRSSLSVKSFEDPSTVNRSNQQSTSGYRPQQFPQRF
ncbi:Integrator complex subunit 7 [Nymphon striatum]|nr:Integrator complex subunit 7 [Nymphon striatum]